MEKKREGKQSQRSRWPLYRFSYLGMTVAKATYPCCCKQARPVSGNSPNFAPQGKGGFQVGEKRGILEKSPVSFWRFILLSTLPASSTLYRLLLLLLLWGPGRVLAQTPALVDSLQRELAAATTDSARVFWLHRLTWSHIVNHTQEAATYNAQARTLAQALGDSLLLVRNTHYQGLIHRFLGEYPEAIEALKTAARYYEAHDMDYALAGAVFNLGVLHGLMGDYEKALAYHYQELAINEKLEVPASVGNTLNSMASVRRKMGQYAEALALYERARQLFLPLDLPKELANVLSNMGGVYLEQGRFDEAHTYFRQALAIDRELDDRWGIAYNLHRLGLVMEAKGRLDSARFYLQEALELRQALDQKLELAETQLAIGKIWHSLGYQAQGIQSMERALAIAVEIGALETQTNAHQILAGTYLEAGQARRAYTHLARYAQLRDSALNEEKLRLTSEMAARYESARKDQQLAENQLEIASVKAEVARQRLLLQGGLAGLMALVVIIGLLLWVFNERRKRHLQQLAHLAQAQELLALRGVMTGEERERSRIARDLHDGLSSLLAAIKIQFNSIQQAHPGLARDTKYEETLYALDEASREVRRIAHNMMPEMLATYGLIEGLHEFVNNLQGPLEVSFSHFGMDQPLDSQTELVLYRMIQELFNNILKHSQATEALLQLNRHDDHLSLTVEDNGRGFIPAEKAAEGLGLANLRSRVSLLQGSLHIDSAPGQGTSVYIDIPLPLSKPAP